MEEVMSTRLQLAFYNSDGSQSTLSPKFFDEGFVRETEKLQKWMEDFSALDVFHHDEKDIALYTGPKAAHLVETKRTKLLG